ncbi:MAG TPA: calcium-binding protein [Solirubrobacterales bacterium]
MTAKHRVSVGALAVVLMLAMAPSAQAVATCSFDAMSGNLSVSMNQSGDFARLDVAGGSQIQLTGTGGNSCTGSPTLANTDIINVADNTPGGGFTTFEIGHPVDFGTEVFSIGLGNFSDVFALIGGPGTDNWRIGSGASGPGIDFDGDGNSELFLAAGIDTWDLVGEGGGDTISGQGFGTLGPFTDAPLLIQGRDGNDVLEGGDHPDGDDMNGEAGDDTLRGFGGNDGLSPGAGDYALDGGAGTQDLVAYGSDTPVTVDLGTTGPQDTGEGTGTLLDVEDVAGSQLNDTLLGSAGTNRLLGAGGDDLLDGRGGADLLDGGSDFLGTGTGSDTVTYAASPSGVTVDLTTGLASGGLGDDTLTQTENVIGSPFADSLVGDAGPNSLTALAGVDTISALAGADSVDVRDGGLDTADCGPDIDSATADVPGLDALTACENVLFAEPSNSFRFGGVKRNKKRGTALLTVVVPGAGQLELARTKKVKPQQVRTGAAGGVKLAIKPSRKTKRILRERGKAKLSAGVTYTPDGGKPNTQSQRVKLVKR